MILTIDLGTTVVKVDVWDADGPRSSGAAALSTQHPAPYLAEQDAGGWWPAVLDACAAARAADAAAYATVDVVGCTSARQTIVAVDASMKPLGPAIVWSDRRASAEAEVLVAQDADLRDRVGVTIDGACVPAKINWLAAHRPHLLAEAAWIVGPKDLVAWHLTGEVATDHASTSVSGCYDATGARALDLFPVNPHLPPVIAPNTVLGPLESGAARALGLRRGIPVVVGAGDRACEVIGAGARPDRPMVSWGTTANLSLPRDDRPDPVPRGGIATRGALGGWLLEAGLSAAGELMDQLAALAGRDATELWSLAAKAPPGADGLVVLPWLGGARAPWWRDGAGAGVVGLAPGQGPGHLGRAGVEGVARDLARGLAALTWPYDARQAQPPVESIALAGRGAAIPLWREIVTAVLDLPAVLRHSSAAPDDRPAAGAAGLGAALLAASATGLDWTLDRLDPVTGDMHPDPALVERYAALAPRADRAARAIVDLRLDPPT
jgi:xylulokinase